MVPRGRDGGALTLTSSRDRKEWAFVFSSRVGHRVGARGGVRQTGPPAAGGHVRRVVTLTQGISADTARAIVKAVKDRDFKKVQVAIQGEELRVSSPSKDTLQVVMAFLRGQDFGVELKFGNYRS